MKQLKTFRANLLLLHYTSNILGLLAETYSTLTSMSADKSSVFLLCLRILVHVLVCV